MKQKITFLCLLFFKYYFLEITNYFMSSQYPFVSQVYFGGLKLLYVIVRKALKQLNQAGNVTNSYKALSLFP